MRLRRNQLCPLHRSLSSAEAEKQFRERNGRARWEFGALKTRIIPGDTGNFGPTAKCGSSSTGRSPSRMDSAPSARRGSPSTATWCPTTSIPAAWAERGGTIIRTTSRLSTGGATEKRGRAEGNAGRMPPILLHGGQVLKAGESDSFQVTTKKLEAFVPSRFRGGRCGVGVPWHCWPCKAGVTRGFL